MAMKKGTKYVLGGVGMFFLLAILGVFSIPANIPVVSGIVDWGSGLLSGVAVVDTRDDAVPDGRQVVIESLLVELTTKHSGNPVAGETLVLYNEGADPSLSTTQAITQLVIGTSYTGKDIKCGKVYKMLVNGSNSMYTLDLGDQVLVACNDMNPETATALLDLTDRFNVLKVVNASLTDLLEEDDTSGDCNGQAACALSSPTYEIGCVAATGTDACVMNYNESSGDGSFYVIITIGADGSQAEVKDYALCFDHEDGAEPEGSEITSFTVQRQSGTQFAALSSNLDWVSLWKNEECVKVGDIESGVSGDYKFSITYDETALDTSDDWKLVGDDLGGNKAKDVLLKDGSDRVIVDFDSVDS